MERQARAGQVTRPRRGPGARRGQAHGRRLRLEGRRPARRALRGAPVDARRPAGAPRADAARGVPEPPASLRRRGDAATGRATRRHAHRDRRRRRARHRLGQPLRGPLRAHAQPDLRAVPVRQRARAHPRRLHQHRADRAAARRARPHRDVLHGERDRRSRGRRRPRSSRAPHEELRGALPGLRGRAATLPYTSKQLDRVPRRRRRRHRLDPARRSARRRPPRQRSPRDRARRVLHRARRATRRSRPRPTWSPARRLRRRSTPASSRSGPGRRRSSRCSPPRSWASTPSAIHIHHGDTDGTHYAPSSHASRITSEMGPAVLQAASLAAPAPLRAGGARARSVARTTWSRPAAASSCAARESRGMSFAQASALIDGRRAPEDGKPRAEP